MASAGRQILHIILSAQWTERYRLESSLSLEYLSKRIYRGLLAILP